MFNRPRRDESNSLQNIPVKANKVLNIIFCILLVIAFKLWHLAVIQHEKKKEEAFLARKRVVIEPAARGTIRDRFNILLAANKLEYRLSIVYSQFREIPGVIFEKDASGSKKKRYVRREYIQKLSNKIAEIIDIDPDRLVDVIYSHAAQNNSIPFVIKNNLTEGEYYQLKLLEKDWQGIEVQTVPRRYYPRGRTMCDVIGYLGPISKEKYTAIINEIHELSDYIEQIDSGVEIEGSLSRDDAEKRLLKLTEKAYTINDNVGLLGIESSFEQDLRGYYGKKVYYSDAKGNVLRPLDGSRPTAPGKRVLLSLSVELQEFAEQLLAQAETDRANDTKSQKVKEPLIRGGAIVALDPKNGELVALASFPRYDPNDFIRKKSTFFSEEPQDYILRWLENDEYIGRVWDRLLPFSLQRFSEKTKKFIDVEEYLTWDRFLELILPENSEAFEKLSSSEPIKKIIQLQQSGDLKDLFLIDLSRLVLSANDFSCELIDKVGDLSIDEYRDLSCAFQKLSSELKKTVRKNWSKTQFAEWRKLNEKRFLKEKRLEEKRECKYPRPYLDYLDREEARQFEEFWKEGRFEFARIYLEQDKLPSNYAALAGQLQELDNAEQLAFLRTLKGFKDLEEPLYGTYPRLVRGKTDCTLQDLVAAVRKGIGEGSLRSYAYRHPAIQGSLFKLVTAYTGLKQKYEELKGAVSRKDLTLFEIVDKTYKHNGKNYVGQFTTGAAIPQIYKSGRIPKSLNANNGKIDLLGALEVSSNPYFSLLAGDYLKDPIQLLDAAEAFGYGKRTGIHLPGEVAGSLPKDIVTNRTGLYSIAIGQHSLLTTPLQSACMLSTIANGGKLLSPRIVNLVVGKDDAFEDNLLFVPPVEDPKDVFMPKEIQKTLLEGLRRVIKHIHQDSSGALRRLSTHRPDQYQAFYDLRDSLIGKTSTAESQEKIGIDIGQPSIIYNHTWFGGISYENGEPDLVVIVYQRYGGYGREVAPIAAQLIKKWRDIKRR